MGETYGHKLADLQYNTPMNIEQCETHKNEFGNVLLETAPGARFRVVSKNTNTILQHLRDLNTRQRLQKEAEKIFGTYEHPIGPRQS